MAQLNSIICTGSARFLNTINGTCDNSLKLQGYTSDTAKTANTIVRRDGNGYIYAAYYNQSSGAETPTSSSYWMYCNSDGWFRKSSLANLRSQLTIPLDHAITSTGSTISVTASATTAKITYNLENPGVRSTTINGNYLRVNTGGTNADLTIPYATSAGSATSATTAGNVTGTVAIANGGTGATTRLGALKALTNESVSTNATYFLTITDSWGKGGYTSVADVKTVLGLGSAAYTASTAYLPSTTKYAASASVGGSATSLADFAVSTTTGLAVENTTNIHGYVSGLTKAAWNYQQTDGAIYAQFYSASWKHQIYGDYRTGHIAVRGKNNGTWQNWLRVWDEGNLKSETAAASGTTLSLVTTGEKATWNAKSNLTIGTTSTTALAGDTKYAGASTAGGAATSAAKLTNTSKVGDTNKPVYFTANGVPAAISYTIDKSVPSTAVFTDTTYTLSADTTNNKIKLTPSSGTAQSITVPYATSAGSATSATLATTASALSSTSIGTENLPVFFTNGGVPSACGFHVFTGTVAANSQVDLNLKFGLVIFGRISTSSTPSMSFIDQWGGKKDYFSNTTHVISVVSSGSSVRVKNNGSTIANYVAIGSTL